MALLAAGTETDPPPITTGDGGASAFLHGPDALFGNVVPLPSTGEVRGLDQDDERLTGEGGVSA